MKGKEEGLICWFWPEAVPHGQGVRDGGLGALKENCVFEMGRSGFLKEGLLAMRETGEWHWSSLENLVEPHWLS